MSVPADPASRSFDKPHLTIEAADPPFLPAVNYWRRRRFCLRSTTGVAAQRDFQLDVTFFVGYMSGPSWVPGRMLLPNQRLPRRVR